MFIYTDSLSYTLLYSTYTNTLLDSILCFGQLIISSLLSVPFMPLVGSSAFVMSYPRTVRFWEQSYATQRLDDASYIRIRDIGGNSNDSGSNIIGNSSTSNGNTNGTTSTISGTGGNINDGSNRYEHSTIVFDSII